MAPEPVVALAVFVAVSCVTAQAIEGDPTIVAFAPVAGAVQKCLWKQLVLLKLTWLMRK